MRSNRAQSTKKRHLWRGKAKGEGEAQPEARRKAGPWNGLGGSLGQKQVLSLSSSQNRNAKTRVGPPVGSAEDRSNGGGE